MKISLPSFGKFRLPNAPLVIEEEDGTIRHCLISSCVYESGAGGVMSKTWECEEMDLYECVEMKRIAPVASETKGQ